MSYIYKVVEASCMAQKSGIVVVVNLCEVEYCNQVLIAFSLSVD